MDGSELLPRTRADNFPSPTPVVPGSWRWPSSTRGHSARRCLRSAAAELKGSDQLRDTTGGVGHCACHGGDLGEGLALVLARHRDTMHRAREARRAVRHLGQTLSHVRNHLVCRLLLEKKKNTQILTLDG